MGVATYKISKDMSERLRKALPSIEDLKKCWMQMKYQIIEIQGEYNVQN